MVVCRIRRVTIDVNDFLKASYVREAKGLSVTLLSIFYRKYARVPPVLGHFSDTGWQIAFRCVVGTTAVGSRFGAEVVFTTEVDFTYAPNGGRPTYSGVRHLVQLRGSKVTLVESVRTVILCHQNDDGGDVRRQGFVHQGDVTAEVFDCATYI